ncbi:TetR/AcrR family transcriptional regulator [Streptomyces sp. GTA36]
MGPATRKLSPRWTQLREQQETAVARTIVEIVAGDPSGLTVAAIAQGAGVSRPTFYKRFPTVEAAIIYTQHRVLQDLGERVAVLLGRQGSEALGLNGRERLLRVFEAMLEAFLNEPDMLHFLSFFDFSFRARGMTDAQRAEHARLSAQASENIEAMFRAGQADGSIDPELPVKVTARALGTSLLGAAQRLQIQEELRAEPGDAIRDTYLSIIASWRVSLAPRRSL